MLPTIERRAFISDVDVTNLRLLHFLPGAVRSVVLQSVSVLPPFSPLPPAALPSSVIDRLHHDGATPAACTTEAATALPFLPLTRDKERNSISTPLRPERPDRNTSEHRLIASTHHVQAFQGSKKRDQFDVLEADVGQQREQRTPDAGLQRSVETEIPRLTVEREKWRERERMRGRWRVKLTGFHYPEEGKRRYYINVDPGCKTSNRRDRFK